MRKKGQASVEFLVVLAMVLTIFTILFSMGQRSYDSSQEAVKSVQARATLKEIVNAADLVHSQGENARTRVYVTMPEDVVEITFSGDCVFMKLYVGGVLQEKHECSDTCLSGEVPTYSGRYWISLQSRRNCVYVGEPKLRADPSALNFEIYVDKD